jgi:hypothetical protein
MNVQHTIIKGIKEQLFFNDYLILPNFGGFVLKSIPSHFSSNGGLIVQPTKKISFNAQLKQNDSVLVTWLQTKLNCSPTESLTHLLDFTEFCNTVLTTKRRLAFDSIGFFYLDFENNLCFEPQADSNFLTASFGLSPISIKELNPEIVTIKKESIFEDRGPIKPTEKNSDIIPPRSYRRLMIASTVSIFCFSLLAALVSNRFMNGSLRASLFGSANKNSYQAISYPDLLLVDGKAKVDTYVADANGIAIIELNSTKNIAVKAREKSLHSKAINNLKSIHYKNKKTLIRFEIVMGCFTVFDNAKRMVNKLLSQNVAAVVSGKNTKGMYVVANGNFQTKEQALANLTEIKRLFPNAWVRQTE